MTESEHSIAWHSVKETVKFKAWADVQGVLPRKVASLLRLKLSINLAILLGGYIANFNAHTQFNIPNQHMGPCKCQGNDSFTWQQ